MKELFTSLWKDESGQGLTEYALIIALVALTVAMVVLLTVHALHRQRIRELMGRIEDLEKRHRNGRRQHRRLQPGRCDRCRHRLGRSKSAHRV